MVQIDNNEEMRSELTIWQQNLNRSHTGQHDLISSGKLINAGIDIVALQEPSINYLGMTIASRDWVPLYPSTHEKDQGKTRAVTLISSKLPTESWEQIEFPSEDVVVIKIKGNWGQIVLFNIYIDCTHNRTLHELTKFYRTNRRMLPQGTNPEMETRHAIWVGDFNRHHPAWDSPEDHRLFTREAIEEAEKLIKVLADHGMEMALAPGVPTHVHNVSKKWTRLDHVFVTEHTIDRILICEARLGDRGLNTDHVPIVTRVDASLGRNKTTKTHNFRNVDWDEFRKVMEAQLTGLGFPRRLANQIEVTRECDRLTKAIQETISNVVPYTTVCPHSKRWWTKEVKDLRKKFRKIGREASKCRNSPEHAVHVEFREVRKIYNKSIKYNKRHHWRDWLEKATEPDLWTASKYITAPPSDGGKTRIPVLKQQIGSVETTASTNRDKSDILAKGFFPKKPATSDRQAEPQEYPDPICSTHKITREQIRRQLKRLKPYKAPGPDNIPNIVLSQCADILTDRLLYIFRAILERGHYYAPWKYFTTVVLRKPGKPRYDVPKAYRPIALLNTMGKLLTAIIAEQLTYYTEKYELLPPMHFGGRPGRTTTDALHALTYRIKDAWRKKQVVSVLFLDIEGAFPNAVNERLIHNLKMRRVPLKIVEFICNMLKERSTALKFDDYTSDRIALDNGIGQGDPLSMALYQYYNADLIDIPTGANEAAAAYVDDAILIATASDFQQTHNILADMMTRPGGAVDWSNNHNSRFEFSKLALIDFAHRNSKKQRSPLVLPNSTIKPSTSAKYLGVFVDQHLQWNTHIAHVIRKGASWSSQIRRAVAPSWGLTPKYARKMYSSVAIPKILYAVDVWGIPKILEETEPHRKNTSIAVSKLTTTQRAGTLAITGCLRTTPTDLLDLHAGTLPIHLEIDKHCHRAAVRIATLPTAHPLHKPAKKCAKRNVKRHKSPLHALMNNYNIHPSEIEKIRPTPRNPALTHKRPFTVSIPASKEASVQEDANAIEKIRVYTDGSSHDGSVGAAAILCRNGQTTRVLHYHLGPSTLHTVHEAELTGILLGLHLVKTEKRGKTSYAIGVDNQAALSSLTATKMAPGQYITDAILETAARIKKTKSSANYSLKFRWTAGHVGIEGNEEVDTEAKKAAEGETSNKKDIPPLLRRKPKHNKSAIKQQRNSRLKARWAQEWKTSPRHNKMTAIDPSFPSSKFLKLISNDKLSRMDTSRLCQLRTGHIPLNGYLERIGKVTNASCPACGHPREDARHFLLDCPAYAHERWTLHQKSKTRNPSLNRLLNDKKLAGPVANFVQATGRFEQETLHQSQEGSSQA